MPIAMSPDILLGRGDDASVVRISDDCAVVQTIDFISPVVNDPYEFGRIAAANALSDIYAMGATPSFALNIVGFPIHSLPIGYLEEILRGGTDMMNQVGVPIVGGHTYDDHAPKYGLTVTGFVHPDRYVKRGSAQPEDALILTKPLGVGIITTAIDKGLASFENERKAIEIMTTLNDKAAKAMMSVGVHACTDVTGFGLLGHLYEMVKDGELCADIHLSQVPVLPEAWKLICEDTLSIGTKNNRQMLSEKVFWDSAVNENERWILCDAQTSGGLLIAVPEKKKTELLDAFGKAGCSAAEIGKIRQRLHEERPLSVKK
ncbi:selenide, water dikinase SelD [Fodinisporobacter ferrooxydans]|uniref:Selenide, water dikinase SelD n=1 Tax=Fodinisporobacter ferrooxydans TaxID=2901836 RepID=A0ABY4CKT0_9BACL|nr:selenide, water dikinase SelD [Alicyclobacillaceae bacterium MYW30-H2]